MTVGSTEWMLYPHLSSLYNYSERLCQGTNFIYSVYWIMIYCSLKFNIKVSPGLFRIAMDSYLKLTFTQCLPFEATAAPNCHESLCDIFYLRSRLLSRSCWSVKVRVTRWQFSHQLQALSSSSQVQVSTGQAIWPCNSPSDLQISDLHAR